MPQEVQLQSRCVLFIYGDSCSTLPHFYCAAVYINMNTGGREHAVYLIDDYCEKGVGHRQALPPITCHLGQVRYTDHIHCLILPLPFASFHSQIWIQTTSPPWNSRLWKTWMSLKWSLQRLQGHWKPVHPPVLKPRALVNMRKKFLIQAYDEE